MQVIAIRSICRTLRRLRRSQGWLKTQVPRSQKISCVSRVQWNRYLFSGIRDLFPGRLLYLRSPWSTYRTLEGMWELTIYRRWWDGGGWWVWWRIFSYAPAFGMRHCLFRSWYRQYRWLMDDQSRMTFKWSICQVWSGGWGDHTLMKDDWTNSLSLT